MRYFISIVPKQARIMWAIIMVCLTWFLPTTTVQSEPILLVPPDQIGTSNSGDSTSQTPSPPDNNSSALSTGYKQNSELITTLLAPPPLPAFGLLEGDDGGFQHELWQNTSLEEIISLLNDLPNEQQEPLLAEATRRLLISKAGLMGETNGLNTKSANNKLLQIRLERLITLGWPEDALAIIGTITDKQILSSSPIIDALLNRNMAKEACSIKDNQIFMAWDDRLAWDKLTIYCSLIAKKMEEANLSFLTFKEFYGDKVDAVFLDYTNRVLNPDILLGGAIATPQTSLLKSMSTLLPAAYKFTPLTFPSPVARLSEASLKTQLADIKLSLPNQNPLNWPIQLFYYQWKNQTTTDMAVGGVGASTNSTNTLVNFFLPPMVNAPENPLLANFNEWDNALATTYKANNKAITGDPITNLADFRLRELELLENLRLIPTKNLIKWVGNDAERNRFISSNIEARPSLLAQIRWAANSGASGKAIALALIISRGQKLQNLTTVETSHIITGIAAGGADTLSQLVIIRALSTAYSANKGSAN